MGPLGHTRHFGQFWMVTVNDLPQTGTWEIHITAEGTARVRVQGEEEGGRTAGASRLVAVSDHLFPSAAQTSLDFLFHFGIPVKDGPHPGLYPLSQPVAGESVP